MQSSNLIKEQHYHQNTILAQLSLSQKRRQGLDHGGIATQVQMEFTVYDYNIAVGEVCHYETVSYLCAWFSRS